MERKKSMVYIDMEKLERVGNNTWDDQERWEKLSIYRVPPQVSKLNPNAYCPQLVSIGPFHNGKAHLLPMEEHKYRALCNFLRRSETSVEDYVSSLKLVADQLMDTYEELDKVWKDENRFVELMLLDGCFLLEVLRAKSKICLGYPPKDPVFSVHGLYTSIYNILPDLFMVENQVPMLVLERLLAVERSIPEEPVVYINRLMFCVWDLNEAGGLGSSLHMLDLKRKIMMGRPKTEEKLRRVLPPQFKWMRPKSILAATQLKKAGITFKKADGYNIGSVKFDRANGVLTLPQFHVSPATEIIELNVSAFEQLHMDANQEVSCFVDFMACLVQCADDAKLLKSKGILVSTMTTYRDIARFVQKLRDDMNFMPKGSLYQLRIEAEEFYWSRTSKWKRRWREWRSNFRETHFKSPWSLLALCAASLLLLLTIEQSVYTTLSYYKS